MSRIQRIVALAAVGLFGAVGVTGVMAGAGGVFDGSSDDSAAAESIDTQTPDSLVAQSGDTPDGQTEVVGDVIDCPSGEATHFKFEQSGTEFEVTGTLVSFDGTTVVVTGPDGDVAAAVDPGAEVNGDPQPGDAVKVEGAVLDDGSFVAHEIKPACEPADDVNDDQGDNNDQGDDENDADGQEVAGDVIPCPSGEDTHFKFEQSSQEFELTGTLVSLDGSTVVVTGPDGDVTAAVDPSAEIKGDPQPGDPVKVEGAVLDDGGLVAREIEPACENEDDSDDADENDDANDDSSSSGDEQSGDDHSDSSHDDSGHDDSGPSGDHGEED